MKNRLFNKISIVISFLALGVSLFTLCLFWSQNNADYEKAVVVQPGVLPMPRINKGKNPLEIEIVNTSKNNLRYFLRVSTNMGCIEGKGGRPKFVPCGYESQSISLSKIDAGQSSYKHILSLDAYPSEGRSNPFLYISEPTYYLTVEALDVVSGQTLYRSECFYSYHTEAQAFGLYQPVAGGDEESRQKLCRP
ncbi:MAG: hypothetical protein QM803_18045 [Rhodocyclaceae bacterium]